MVMGKQAAVKVSAVAQRQWRNRLQSLSSNVAQWAKEKRWPVSSQEKVIEEQAIGSYPAKVLNIKTPAGWLVIEPIAYSVVGAHGRVDLYSFPTFHRVRLLWDGKKWAIRTDSGVDF